MLIALKNRRKKKRKEKINIEEKNGRVLLLDII